MNVRVTVFPEVKATHMPDPTMPEVLAVVRKHLEDPAVHELRLEIER